MRKRRKARIWMSVLLSLIFAFGGVLQVSAVEETESPSYVPGELLVLYREDVSDEEAEQLVEIQGDDRIEVLAETQEGTIAMVQVAEGTTVEQAAEMYASDNRVIAATPNYEMELYADSIVNDVDYAQQDYLAQTNVPQAWNIVNSAGHNRIKVAVLDTGVDISHPDLRNVLNLRDSKEVLDLNGNLGPLKGDGYQSGVKTTGGGHGTHVAGILAAEANNGQGIAGVASVIDNSAVELIAVDVFSNDKTTNLSYVIKGLEYAKAAGAKVINLSLGMKKSDIGENDVIFRTLCRSLADEDIILVCAAGNDGKGDNGTISTIPSDYDSTISVIALDGAQKRSSSSNYGSLKDISAPGKNIHSTTKGGTYGRLNGTSMSSPEVSGIVAMMCSINPELTVEEVREILTTTATDIGTPGFDVYTAAGIVDAQAAVTKVIDNKGTGEIHLPYSDVKKTDWYYDAACFLYQNKIMTGMTATSFGPSEKVSRAQFATILFRVSGEESVPYSSTFPDVSKGEFYTDAVLWAASKDVIMGYDNGEFGPADEITREQMAVILYRYTQYRGIDVSNKTNLNKFPDSFRVSGFAQKGMEWAVAEGIISGNEDGTLAPTAPADRAASAMMMKRFITKFLN